MERGHFSVQVHAVVGQLFGYANKLDGHHPPDASDDGGGDHNHNDHRRHPPQTETVEINYGRPEQEIERQRQGDRNQNGPGEIKHRNHSCQEQDGFAGDEPSPGTLGFQEDCPCAGRVAGRFSITYRPGQAQGSWRSPGKGVSRIVYYQQWPRAGWSVLL